jgi:hypothetical protein
MSCQHSSRHQRTGLELLRARCSVSFTARTGLESLRARRSVPFTLFLRVGWSITQCHGTCLYWTDFFSSVARSCIRAQCSPASRRACSWQPSSTVTSCCSKLLHSARRVWSDEHNSCSLRSAVRDSASRACAISTPCHRHAPVLTGTRFG